jgi:periplasmic divalent cation tolerance protein
METIRIVLCTFPDLAAARQISTSLIERQLAACVNLVPSIESIYRWQGRIVTEGEVLAIFKTTTAALDDFRGALAELHPYEVPEILAIEPAAVSASYRAWLERECPACVD